jgi:hypothetical protein
MPQQHNTWVDKLLGLYQNSMLGNADNRGLDSEFARSTYIDTKLDTELLPDVVRGKFKAVFLTGNPGDGKTAFLEKVFIALTRNGSKASWRNSSGWALQSDALTFTACYDASESYEGVSSDDRLNRIFRSFEGPTESTTKNIVLVAINDGKLHSFFHHYQRKYEWLSHVVLQKALFVQPNDDDRSSVVIVNLKERALVDLNLDNDISTSIFDRLLQTFTHKKNWQVCLSCDSANRCPIFLNAAALGWANSTKQAKSRLKLLFVMSHIRRQRHNTIRDIRSALAFLITSNLQCENVHRGQHSAGHPLELSSSLFFNSIFTANDEALSEFSSIDPARESIPQLDRQVSVAHSANDFGRFNSILPLSSGFPSDFKTSQAIAEFRRRLFFEGRDNLIEGSLEGISRFTDLLPYRYLNEFLDMLRAGSVDTTMVKKICMGISHVEGVRDREVVSESLVVRVTYNAKEGLVICREFRHDEFTVKVQKRDTPYIESVPDRLILYHKPTTMKVELTLDLFELLMRTADGLVANSEEHKPVLDELADFKARLHRSKSENLLLIEDNGQKHRIRQHGGKVVRLSNGVQP